MNEKQDSLAVTQIKRHQFASLLVGTLLIAFFFVFVAMSLYQNDTIQLDLSRPGYETARKEASKDSAVYTGFSSTGSIDNESLKEFDKLYSEKTKEATAIDAFSGDALSDATLNLETDK